MPATLPWPKIPKHPEKNRWRTPSRSTSCAARNRIRAWATVMVVVLVMWGSRRGSRGTARALQIVAQPRQGCVQARQLGAEPLSGDGGVQPCVRRDRAAGERPGGRRAELEQLGGQVKRGDRAACQLHPIGVLAAAAVQDAAGVALQRGPDQLGGVGGEGGGGEPVEPVAVPHGEAL